MSKMSKGRITIPTDSTYVEGTKKYIELWGADAVRDCDGVSLPKDVKQFGTDVYKAYFIVREDHDYALKHKEYWQNVALMSQRKIAYGSELIIDLLENTFKDALEPNETDYRKWWQVIDRTTGRVHEDYDYLGLGKVRINNCLPYHEYTVNFFARNTWDPVQIYNYHVNNWTCPKDIDLDPVYPEALHHMLERMELWLKANPDVTVVRFTTFFYNFFIVNVTGIKQRIWDWHCYAMSTSPAMFELFKKEKGVEMSLEDLIGGGYYSNRFVIPSKKQLAYEDFVEEKCAAWAKQFVDLCHKYNKKALMFDGDHRIGVEPYSPYFPSIGLDGVVGAPSGAIYISQVANIKGVKFTEGRLNPYFFPNECPSDEKGKQILLSCWNNMRRGLLKKSIDRIGFGGYLKQIENYPLLTAAIKDVCDEFRGIADALGDSSCFSKGRIAVLSYRGRRDSWMMNGTFVDDARQGGCYYHSLFDALAVLPFEVEFISFEEASTRDLSAYDCLLSCGVPNTSFAGGKAWENPELVSNIRRYVHEGGAFFGVGEPTASQYQGRFFQLSDVLGVEKECEFTHFEKRDPFKTLENHWIKEGVDMSLVGYNRFQRNVYPLTATVLTNEFDWEYPEGQQNAANVHFAVNEYGKGRGVYLSGITCNDETIRLLYRAFLWAMKKEDETKRLYALASSVDVFYYEEKRMYALYNDSEKEVATSYYDLQGNLKNVSLKGKEIVWLDERGLKS